VAVLVRGRRVVAAQRAEGRDGQQDPGLLVDLADSGVHRTLPLLRLAAGELEELRAALTHGQDLGAVLPVMTEEGDGTDADLRTHRRA